LGSVEDGEGAAFSVAGAFSSEGAGVRSGTADDGASGPGSAGSPGPVDGVTSGMTIVSPRSGVSLLTACTPTMAIAAPINPVIRTMSNRRRLTISNVYALENYRMRRR